jgi:hypothetical protein
MGSARCDRIADRACAGSGTGPSGGPASADRLRIAVPRDIGPPNIFVPSTPEPLVELISDELVASSPYVAQPQPGKSTVARAVVDQGVRRTATRVPVRVYELVSGEAGSGRRRGKLPTTPGASPITSPTSFVAISIQPAEPPGPGQQFSGAEREAGRRVSAPHRRGDL